MSIGQHRKRLERLIASRAVDNADQDRGPDFRIDPALAKSLRDDDVRLYQLLQKEISLDKTGGLTAAEIEERGKLNQSVVARASRSGWSL